MVASIAEFGFSVPVLARSSGEVVDGHLRLKGARRLGMAEVPVIPCDGWTDAQLKASRLTGTMSRRKDSCRWSWCRGSDYKERQSP